MLDNLNDMLKFNWQIIPIISLIIIIIRIGVIIIKKEKIVLYKEILNLIFIIYLSCLCEIVFFSQDIIAGQYSFNLIPFKEILRYEFGSHLFIKNIVGNIILFMPYGFFIGHFLKKKQFKLVLIISLITSMVIETIQLYIGRAFDLDDILLNVGGAIIGFTFYKLIYYLNLKIPEKYRNIEVLNVLLISILIIILILVRYVVR